MSDVNTAEAGEAFSLLDFGDHVTSEGREATTVVVHAGEYEFEKNGETMTVAECVVVDPSEVVSEVVFSERTTKDLENPKGYL